MNLIYVHPNPLYQRVIIHFYITSIMFTKNIFLKKKYDKTNELKINDVYVFVFFFFLIKFFYQHFFFFWIFFLKICGPPSHCTSPRARLRLVKRDTWCRRLPMLDYRPTRARTGPTRSTAAASGRRMALVCSLRTGSLIRAQLICY